jgi:hypothetical protein
VLSGDESLMDLPSWAARTEPLPSFTGAHGKAFVRSGLCNPVLEVPPPVYFERLCGLVPDRNGFVCCPIHEEVEASCKVYPTSAQGWFCYGESCRRGGDVVTLAAELARIPTPVRGVECVQLLGYLAGRLLW